MYGKTRYIRLQIALIAVLALPSTGALALSESRTFFASKIYDDRPQLCNAAGTGCGKKAADTWCKQVGYEHAMSFLSAPDSKASARALRVGNGELCAQDQCNGFHFVKCRRDLGE
ncbi:MAG: hypothetical protein ACR2OM_10350 [Aestuariivirgaceae bacterium]